MDGGRIVQGRYWHLSFDERERIAIWRVKGLLRPRWLDGFVEGSMAGCATRPNSWALIRPAASLLMIASSITAIGTSATQSAGSTLMPIDRPAPDHVPTAVTPIAIGCMFSGRSLSESAESAKKAKLNVEPR